MAKAFRLMEPVVFQAPPPGFIAPSPCGEKSFTIPAGALVLYHGSDGWAHLYRVVSDGRFGLLDAPPDDRFARVDDPEIAALAGLVMTLPEMLAKKGLEVQTTSDLDPFRIISCPLCGSGEFTTIDFASVWCSHCNTRFTTRHTAGDPGVVVDADPCYYNPYSACYVIPHHGPVLTVVLKDFGYSAHPEGRCGPYCVNGTTYEERAAQGRYVRNPTSLQDNTRWCGLEVYDWTIWGRVEPHSAGTEMRVVAGDPDAPYHIYGKMIPSSPLPSRELLAPGDEEGNGREWWYLANVTEGGLVIWWKVTAETEEQCGVRRVRTWKVVDRSLCPVCLKPAAHGDHKYCKWDRIGWSPDM